MPSVLKRFMSPAAETYEFPDAASLSLDDEVPPAKKPEDGKSGGGKPGDGKPGDGKSGGGKAGAASAANPAPAQSPDGAGKTDAGSAGRGAPAAGKTPAAGKAPAAGAAPASGTAAETDSAPGGDTGAVKTPKRESQVDFARVQADAILAQARREAEELKEQALKDAQKELAKLKKKAHSEGYQAGYNAGMADGTAEARVQLNKMAEKQAKDVREFLEAAAREKEKLLDESQDELKELALAVAEKIIRISLRSNSDIILRMIESATDKHKRCVWAHIYIADCDIRGMAFTLPELADALRHISDRVRIVPMADDESGTCIIEMPDEIIDASVSTQMDSIRDVISNVSPDR